MASITSQFSLAIDHQAKVVGHAKGGKGSVSFTVVGDSGHILFYGVVPNDDLAWTDSAMREILKRHGAKIDPTHSVDPKNPHKLKLVDRGRLPPVIYVDKDCCNGVEGGRTEDTKYFYGMEKLLDIFHLILRIGRQINSEHDRKGKFMRHISQSIYVDCDQDVARLEQARSQLRVIVGELTTNQKKAERRTRVKRIVRNAEEVVKRLLVVLKANIALDREARAQFEASGASCTDLTPAHDAYPLITKKVSRCVIQQCWHVLNGCITNRQSMNLEYGASNYRNTGPSLPRYRSMQGTSKVEAVHSVVDGEFYYTLKNLRQIVFNARAHWKFTNYNRERSRRAGKDALPDSVAPSEYADLIPFNFNTKTDLLFGFDYYNHLEEGMERDISARVRADLDANKIDTSMADGIFNDDDDGDNGDVDDAAATDAETELSAEV